MTTENRLHKNIRISGRVQGVAFRYHANQMASLHNIKGFIRNLTNGDVYLEVEGNYDQLEPFIQWCHQGPPHARVNLVHVEIGEIVGFRVFEIRI
jgi:acylphosphatase